MATKITALPARATVATTDVIPVVDAAAGTPATQKATVALLRTALMPIVNADVSASAAIAGTKVSPNFGAQNVVTTGAGSFGTTPAAAGAVRMPNAASLSARNAGNTADKPLIEVSTDDQIRFGYGSGAGPAPAGYVFHDGGNFGWYSGSVYKFYVSTLTFEMANPVIGNASPYSVHGKTTVATAGTFTVAAADYVYDAILLTGGTAGTVTFPLPATDAVAFYKTVINTSGVTKTLSNGGATTQALATATTGRYLFDTAGVHLVSPTTAYP